jgi:hypothetical protein
MQQYILCAALFALLVSCGRAYSEEPRALDSAEVLQVQIEAKFDQRPLREVLETVGKAAGLKVRIDCLGSAGNGISDGWR